jgi:cyclopropane-fatty-acyl-phospholipid synthase
VAAALNDAGFELRHEENIREHYAMTLRDWGRNLDEHWNEAVSEVGEVRARVWALYMAGSRLFFATNQLQLHQVLCTRTEGGNAGMALRPDW